MQKYCVMTFIAEQRFLKGEKCSLIWSLNEMLLTELIKML